MSTPRSSDPADQAQDVAPLGGDAEGSQGSDERARLQRQARALGNATRFAIFQHVTEAGAPVRVAALVERFALNHNAVRQHLAKLCEAGLLVEDYAPRTGPGRPALEYRPATDLSGRWGTPHGHEQLAWLLLQMASEGLPAREVGRRAGRAAVAGAAVGSDTSLEDVIAQVRRLGFVPGGLSTSEGIEVVMDDCPYPSATAAAYPEIVCEIHRGLIEGILEAVRSDLEVNGLQIRTAEEPRCTLRLRSPGSTPSSR